MVRAIAGGTWDSATRIIASEHGRRQLGSAKAWLLNYLWKRDVVSREELADAYGRGKRDPVNLPTIDVMISRLRHDLEAIIPGATIQNIRDHGWQLVGDRDDIPRCPHCGRTLFGNLICMEA
jgi:DNA-binding response OmpR family regulator